VGEDLLVEWYHVDVPDNLKARRVRTQFEVFRRVISFAVFVVALGIALTTFEWAKTIGTSVLASAGIVGLAAGLAARPNDRKSGRWTSDCADRADPARGRRGRRR
jgi:hypothetical protein